MPQLQRAQDAVLPVVGAPAGPEAGLDLEALRLHNFLQPRIDDHVERMIAGADEVGDGSIAKLSFAETYHRVSAYGAELSATVCTVAADASVDEAKQRLRECWLWSRAYTVSGGSSEMMRNILAKRRLALPSG